MHLAVLSGISPQGGKSVEEIIKRKQQEIAKEGYSLLLMRPHEAISIVDLYSSASSMLGDDADKMSNEELYEKLGITIPVYFIAFNDEIPVGETPTLLGYGDDIYDPDMYFPFDKDIEISGELPSTALHIKNLKFVNEAPDENIDLTSFCGVVEPQIFQPESTIVVTEEERYSVIPSPIAVIATAELVYPDLAVVVATEVPKNITNDSPL